jgi:hypothetical protein
MKQLFPRKSALHGRKTLRELLLIRLRQGLVVTLVCVIIIAYIGEDCKFIPNKKINLILLNYGSCKIFAAIAECDPTPRSLVASATQAREQHHRVRGKRGGRTGLRLPPASPAGGDALWRRGEARRAPSPKIVINHHGAQCNNDKRVCAAIRK